MTRGLRRIKIVDSPLVELAAAILRDTPLLHDALCQGRPQLFDGDGPHGPRTAAAITMCRACPVLAECRAWWRRIPTRRRPRGVIGGIYLPHAGEEEATIE